MRNYDRDLPLLTVYGSELNQVWTNLLDNAIDAIGERGGAAGGGELAPGRIEISTRADGPCALVEISDNGIGIAPELRERIFESFFTTKEVGQGTGLGLATARRIVVDRLGGSLSVESRAGRTTFHVWLPFPSQAIHQPATERSSP